MAQMEYELAAPPLDGITRVCFAPDTNHLLVSSWDSFVRLYDVQSSDLRATFPHKAGVLDCCFADSARCFSGGVDRAVKMYDLNTQTETLLGQHDKAVRCTAYSQTEGMLVTGSWDKTIKLFDPRSPFMGANTTMMPDKVFTLSVSGYRLVVGTAGRHISIYDLRAMTEPQQRRESSLKYQTRCVACFPDGAGYALSSIEGRVAMEYFDPGQDAQAKKYAFKCHRIVNNGVDTVFPVNTIAFHPRFGTFATGGCDGYVNVWDGANKKRLCQFHKYPTSIASLCFNHDGTLLAIASSYTYEEGEKDHPGETIFIRQIGDEVRPKAPGVR